MSPSLSLGTYLDTQGYGEPFQQDHLLPMAAAIWSASALSLRDYPAAQFIRFCDNHGLLKFTGRPVWRTVDGGSQMYVQRLLAAIADVRLGLAARAIRRTADHVVVRDAAAANRHSTMSSWRATRIRRSNCWTSQHSPKPNSSAHSATPATARCCTGTPA